MCSHSTTRKPDTTMCLGLFAMVAGALSLRLHTWFHVNPDLADGIAGLFYGVAIAALLLSVRSRRTR